MATPQEIYKMKFKEAYEALKQGYMMKLPSWAGYWVWDFEKETIMMHTKDGEVMDIRETQRVEYTLDNILSDDWLFAGEDNTPLLGGVAYMGFGDAIKLLKRGMKLARKGWNGKNMWLGLVKADNYAILFPPHCGEDTADGECHGLLPWIGMKTADNKFVPWIASQTDMLSDDWVVVD